MRTRTILICELCKKEFLPISGSLKQRFCGKKCGYLGKKWDGKKGKHYPHLQRARKGNCLVCDKEYRAIHDFKGRNQKYCSLECKEKAWTKDIRPKMKDNPGVKGELNHSWKGDNVGYHGVHHWVIRELGRPEKCEHCGTESAKKFEWANKDHTYKRIKEDYMRLCTRCHRRYDYENNHTGQKAIKVL